MELDEKSREHLESLLDMSQESFEGLFSRWNEFQPQREFSVRVSEDFHLGFIFGKLEGSFVDWFYSNYGRSMTDSEYRQFWMTCRKLVRSLHEKYDTFYFQE